MTAASGLNLSGQQREKQISTQGEQIPFGARLGPAPARRGSGRARVGRWCLEPGRRREVHEKLNEEARIGKCYV